MYHKYVIYADVKVSSFLSEHLCVVLYCVLLYVCPPLYSYLRFPCVVSVYMFLFTAM